VKLFGGQRTGRAKGLGHDVAAVEKVLTLRFGELVLVVSRLVVEGRGDVAVDVPYCSLAVPGLAIH
jgi:hypothetical protein